jgi:hypothetical protein
MKKFYILICAVSLISLTSPAQTFTHTYTANVPGDWAPAFSGDPSIWSTGQPPVGVCDNCLVQLIPPAGSTIIMNSAIYLNSNSQLIVGAGVTLKFSATTATAFDNPANLPHIIVLSTVGHNFITWASNTATIDASAAGPYDGVLTSNLLPPPNAPNTFILLKEIGNAPLQFTNNVVTNLNPASLGQTFNGPFLDGLGDLPILLSSFTAQLDQDVVNLDWTTTVEINADHIAVQRSVDAGGHWTTIGTEAAKNTTATPTNYVYADSKPASGTSEYRLQLVDKDGTSTYSQVRTIRNGLIGAVSVFPNPARDYVNVTLGGSATENLLVRLYNQSGQLLQLKNVANAGGTTVALSVASYPAGNYLIVVNGADGSKQVSNVLISK